MRLVERAPATPLGLARGACIVGPTGRYNMPPLRVEMSKLIFGAEENPGMHEITHVHAGAPPTRSIGGAADHSDAMPASPAHRALASDDWVAMIAEHGRAPTQSMAE